MINIRRFVCIAVLAIISMSVFCQKIDKIDRTKQRTEKSKGATTSKSTSNSQTKSQTQSTQQKKQSQTAHSKSTTQSSKSQKNTNNSRQQQTNQHASPYLTVSPISAEFGSEGGTRTFQIQSNNSWSIKVIPTTWGSLERNGNTLTLRVKPTNSEKPRNDTFIITSAGIDQKVTITQSGNPNLASYLSASESSLTFYSSGGSTTINISSNRNWRIKIGTNSWGKLQQNGNTLTVSVEANNTGSRRTDYFVLEADGVECKVGIIQYAAVITNSSNSSTTTNSSSVPYYRSIYSKSSARKRWWRTNFSVGIDGDFETNINGEFGADMFYSAGLLFRFGNCQQVFSVMTGVKYRWMRVMPEYEDAYYRDTRWQLYGGSLVVPLYLRFNFARLSHNCKLFLGLGGEFGAKVFPSSGTENIMNDYYYALSPQLGFFWRHYEMAFYWKMYPQSPFVSSYSESEDKYKCNSMLGMSMSIYF